MKIGEITYTDSKGVYPALYVYGNSSVRHGLSFEKVPGLPKKAESRLFNIDEVLDRAVRGVYNNVSEMFPKNEFDTLMEDVVVKATFFQDHETFVRAHGKKYKNCCGLYHSHPLNKIKRGSYVSIGSSHDLETTLLHEWGHDFLYQFCRSGISEYLYECSDGGGYDPVMREVFAILFERLAGKDEYDENPHKTADKLVTRIMKQQKKLEKISGDIRFSDAIRYALRFNNHEGFGFSLSLLENINNPKRILKIIQNAHRQK